MLRKRRARMAEELARLFLGETDLGLKPSSVLLRAFGLDGDALLRFPPSAVSLEAAERAAERESVVVVEAYG